MKLKEFLAPRVAAVKETVWPEGAVCLSCGKLSDGEPLCPECRKILFFRTESSWTRRPCKELEVWSLRPHRGVARDLVLKLKHGTAACAAEELLKLVLPLPEEVTFTPDTVVTWVTMPPSRLRERGIDHGRLLAEGTASLLGLPCRQLLLRKDRRLRTQQGLSAKQRVRNLRDVFSVPEPVASPVLLVDDVFTTGTTAGRCAEVLVRAGAPKITVLTFTY